MNYVANGEIGVAIGFVTPANKTPKGELQLSVEFSSQPGFQYSYWPEASEGPAPGARPGRHGPKVQGSSSARPS